MPGTPASVATSLLLLFISSIKRNKLIHFFIITTLGIFLSSSFYHSPPLTLPLSLSFSPTYSQIYLSSLSSPSPSCFLSPIRSTPTPKLQFPQLFISSVFPQYFYHLLPLLDPYLPHSSHTPMFSPPPHILHSLSSSPAQYILPYPTSILYHAILLHLLSAQSILRYPVSPLPSPFHVTYCILFP